jgi:hypothetical protein
MRAVLPCILSYSRTLKVVSTRCASARHGSVAITLMMVSAMPSLPQRGVMHSLQRATGAGVKVGHLQQPTALHHLYVCVDA